MNVDAVRVPPANWPVTFVESGYKLRSIEQLPDEFRQRAGRDYPQLLRVEMRFSKPILGLVE